MKSVSIKKCTDGKNPQYTSRYVDGNRPSISSVSGALTNGAEFTINGNFSAKRNGQLFKEVPVLGEKLADGYVYQDDVPGFGGTLAAVADCLEGEQWNGWPTISHDYVSECHLSCYFKIDVIKAGNEAPTWVATNAYKNGDYVSYDPGPYMRRYLRINTPTPAVTATAPNLDTTNWRSNDDDWQDIQFKLPRIMVDGIGNSSHSGLVYFTAFGTSDQVPGVSKIIKGRLLGNYQGEDLPGGSTSQEFDDANILKLLGGDWVYMEFYGKASTANLVRDGSVFAYFRNEVTKDFSWQHIDGGEGNRNYNDRRHVGTIPRTYEFRYVVDVGYPKGTAGAYTPLCNRFLLTFQKRPTTVCKVYHSHIIANDSPEAVFLINGPDINTAFESGKFMQQPQNSRSINQIKFKVFLGELTPEDDIHVFVRNSNGRSCAPFKIEVV